MLVHNDRLLNNKVLFLGQFFFLPDPIFDNFFLTELDELLHQVHIPIVHNLLQLKCILNRFEVLAEEELLIGFIWTSVEFTEHFAFFPTILRLRIGLQNKFGAEHVGMFETGALADSLLNLVIRVGAKVPVLIREIDHTVLLDEATLQADEGTLMLLNPKLIASAQFAQVVFDLIVKLDEY